jgi:GntR family transcriptional repressor for pyruvate dehydrogenase complex
MFQKIKQNRISENISNQIFQSILRGELKPKDKLPSANELTGIFGVSRVTVREAIRSLEQLGMVEVRQGIFGGAYIKEMNFDTIVEQIGNSLRMINVTFQQLAEARAMLEEIVLAKLIPRTIDPQDINRLQSKIQTAEDYFKGRKHNKRLEDNFEFHSMLVKLSGNPVIILMHKLIVNLSIAFFENVKPSTPMVEETFEDHKKIVELLRKNKFEEAAKLCSSHIKAVSSRIVQKSKQQSLLEIVASSALP